MQLLSCRWYCKYVADSVEDRAGMDSWVPVEQQGAELRVARHARNPFKRNERGTNDGISTTCMFRIDRPHQDTATSQR